MNKSETIIELSKALSKFQGEVKQPKKDNDNPFFKSKYVNLEGVVDAISKSASKYGLSYMQFPVNDEDKVGIYTLVMHESGEWIQSEPIFTRLTKQDPQAVGSALTYLRRYSLSAVFGITSETDDDGEGAMNRGGNQQPYQQQPKQQYQSNSNSAPQQSNNLISEAQIKLVKTKLSICAQRDTEQMKSIYTAALNNLGIDPNAQSKDLTKAQASKVIEYLTNLEPKK